MKHKALIFTSLVLLAMIYTSAQDLPGQTKDGNINILDAGASSLGTIFQGDSLLGNKGNKTKYLDIVKMSNLPPEEKKRLTESYLMYSKSLDPKSRDSVEQAMARQFMEQLPQDSLSQKKDSHSIKSDTLKY